MGLKLRKSNHLVVDTRANDMCHGHVLLTRNILSQHPVVGFPKSILEDANFWEGGEGVQNNEVDRILIWTTRATHLRLDG